MKYSLYLKIQSNKKAFKNFNEEGEVNVTDNWVARSQILVSVIPLTFNLLSLLQVETRCVINYFKNV